MRIFISIFLFISTLYSIDNIEKNKSSFTDISLGYIDSKSMRPLNSAYLQLSVSEQISTLENTFKTYGKIGTKLHPDFITFDVTVEKEVFDFNKNNKLNLLFSSSIEDYDFSNLSFHNTDAMLGLSTSFGFNNNFNLGSAIGFSSNDKIDLIYKNYIKLSEKIDKNLFISFNLENKYYKFENKDININLVSVGFNYYF